MFVVFERNKITEIINLDNITEIKCDYYNNILSMYKDVGVWDNWTFVNWGALTNAYNYIIDGLHKNKKIIIIREGLVE